MVTSDEGDSPPVTRQEDVVTDILMADRRRFALDILDAADDPMAIDDLAAAVRAHELGVDPDDVARPERRSVREQFFEIHLPKLTATDVVEFDSVLGSVSLAESPMAAAVRTEASPET